MRGRERASWQPETFKRWGGLHFPMVPQSDASVYMLLWDDAANTVCNAVPTFKFVKDGVYQPTVDKVVKSVIAFYQVDAQGGCVWVKEPAPPNIFGTVNLYNHKCVRIGPTLLLDWGYDQYTLPANVSLRLCEL